MTKDKPPLKNIYRKSLAMDLIKMGNDLHHTMINRNNRKYQVYVFRHDDKLIEDMLYINRMNRINKRYENGKQ